MKSMKIACFQVRSSARKVLIILVLFSLMGLAACSKAPEQETDISPLEQTEQIDIYYLDENQFVAGIEPYEAAVSREIPLVEEEAAAIMRLLFEGPSADEYEAGLRLVNSGCEGFSEIEVAGGIARVYLYGNCNSSGSTYTVANLIFVNLKQLDNISYVKIYDESGSTESPEGDVDSIPFSLEP